MNNNMSFILTYFVSYLSDHIELFIPLIVCQMHKSCEVFGVKLLAILMGWCLATASCITS